MSGNIVKTEAIVLRMTPVTNTSRVVTWLSRDWGKITTMVKGSQRPKSMFLGQYDLFYTCELLFYPRRQDKLFIARECSPIRTRPELRVDWKSTATASYLDDLINRITPVRTPVPEIYRLYEDTLDELCTRGSLPALVFWFELKLLDILGLSPRLTTCIRCKRNLVPGKNRSSFSYSDGGLLCVSCTKQSGTSSLSIAPDILATLLAWQRSKQPQAARATRSRFQQLDQIQALLSQFIRYHLDIPLNSRDIMFDILNRKVS